MPVVSARGTTATHFGPTPNFSPLGNAVDVGSGTFCNSSGNAGPKGVYITGHGLSSYFTSSATINSITVSSSLVTNGPFQWAGWTAEIEVGGVVVGTGQYHATSSTPAIYTFTITGVTAADLLDPTMKLKMAGIRSFALTVGTLGIDYADLIVDYTPLYTPTLGGYWGGLTI